MDGTRLESLIAHGYNVASQKLGTVHRQYRSSTMLDPLGNSNFVKEMPASFTPRQSYLQFSKPNDPMFIGIIDRATVENGDWLVNADGGVFFIAEKQPIVPLPVVQCNCKITISRPVFSTSSGDYESSETVIASNFPAFMTTKSNSNSQPDNFPAATNTVVVLGEWRIYINTRGVGDVRVGDVIIDEAGVRYQILTPHLTQFGFIVTAKLEHP